MQHPSEKEGAGRHIGHFLIVRDRAPQILLTVRTWNESSGGNERGLVMTKLVLAMVATFAFVSVASAADLPRREPPPVATVGKAPIGKLPGKYPVGKYPVGKYPVIAKA
jgi:hypothetical protein